MLHLELMELADLVRPEQIVDEIVRQNPDLPLPVPVEDLARLAGITKIDAFSTGGFEGALVTNAAKSEGAIFYSGRSPKARQRFTVGHELGHFLLPWHRRSSFQCVSEDVGFSSTTKTEWEVQANEFAAALLMPPSVVKRRLQALGEPELAHILRLRDEFGTSTEMTARRLVELSEYACAVVFSRDNIVRYSVRSQYFAPWLCVRKGDRLPQKSLSRLSSSDPDEWHELDGQWWLEEQCDEEMPESVYEQTLLQENGHKMTLVTYEPA